MRFKIAMVVLLVAITISLVGVGVLSDMNTPTSMGEEPKIDYSFSVMSFNVRTYSFDLIKNPNDDIDLRTPLILSQVSDANPDIIGMQEWTFMHEGVLLEELMKTYGFIAQSRDGSIFGEKCAIFYKLERFELVESYTYWVSETPEELSLGWDASIYRICTVAILKDKLSGETIRFGNVHLDHVATEARIKGTRLVIDRAVESEYPAIQVGDFNYDTFSTNYSYCVEQMEDARLLAPDAITTSSYNGWNDAKIADGGFPIDHVFLTKGAFEVYSYDVLDYKVDGLFASDHFALVVKLELK